MKRNSLRWIFNCHRWFPTKDDLLIALSCIQEEERNRIFNFVYKKDVKLALIGQLMLRRCVSDCLDIHYDQVSFRRTDKAADSIDKIGVDISKVKQSNQQSTDEYFKTMERIFSPQEWKLIKSQDPMTINQSPLHRFHRFWALKESFVKAKAIGIGYELRRIQFNCPTINVPINQIVNDTLVNHDGLLSNNWMFEESLIDGNHFISVALSADDLTCFRQQSTNNFFQFVQFNQLINPNVHVVVTDDFWVKYNNKEEGRHV
ncbi:L-aminoadipate-semialdehyde dehydrogenase-phosphopantetheinyl transferase-like isoform X2 [Panonychus citri]|uniref:L-aminoadipate-semialdehyde dehydrogenase-phosphopantetheinyl transferase-like isoform X2 n=1 Tax=Panonychus citri TaxID=50023 RepID=UPI002307440D|nr:L-aminoadipate-semialdehyde dehydrogenase-phosphopantetheinyl transferase-like isoform X2 [Panonychus citri]